AGAGGDGLAIQITGQSTQTQWTFSPSYCPAPGCNGGLGQGLNTGDISNQPYVTLYQYDGLGNLLCVEQHGNVTGTGCGALASSDASSPWRVRRFSYDSLGRLLTATN